MGEFIYSAGFKDSTIFPYPYRTKEKAKFIYSGLSIVRAVWLTIRFKEWEPMIALWRE